MSVLLFVYGTLKRGCSNHGQLEGQAFVGEARTAPGYRLFDVGGFPGLVPWAADTGGVEGEVWETDGAGLARLDAFEGLAEGLYVRHPVPLQPPFAGTEVQAYVYPGSVDGCREVGPRWTE
jgi:gamma-glutamylcyclotransferase (GGCT)/AIG2-like uncharacterized protein YtfP